MPPPVTPPKPSPTVPPKYVAQTPKDWVKKTPPAGWDYECVALVKKAANIPLKTTQWKAGQFVKDVNLPVGTAIATFVGNPPKYEGHAALYLGQNKEGIQVVDQWAARPARNPPRAARPPQERTIRWNGTGLSDNGNSFRVIE
jgi:hypothetical protein